MQVHDELVYMHRPNDDAISHAVAKIFIDAINCRITGYGTMVIPCEPKFGAVNWGEFKEIRVEFVIHDYLAYKQGTERFRQTSIGGA